MNALAEQPIVVLLIEDNPGDVRLAEEALEDLPGRPFTIETASRLSAGLERIAEGGVGVVLLDLDLPDTVGLDTLLTAHHQAPDVPIVVLTGLDDGELGVEAMRQGAQDYLVKGDFTPDSLTRSLRYAIGRHETLKHLRMMSAIDELTGLSNRRGFLTLADQLVKLADRNGHELVVAFADLDGLKRINDTWGHDEGDHALIDVARLLTRTFRESDVVARFGGDEFVVMMVECPREEADVMIARLHENLAVRNDEKGRRYVLSLSMGTAVYDPLEPCSVEELLRRADTAMYEQKRAQAAGQPA